MSTTSSNLLINKKSLDYTKPLAPQIEAYVVELSHKNYVLFDIVHFVHLHRFENQVNHNYIVVERQKDEFVIYDNVDWREEHKNRFTDAKKAAAYVELLLNQKTVFDFAQCRAVSEKGVSFGDKVIIVRPDKTSVTGKIIGHGEAFPDEVEKLKNEFCTQLYYIPLKKDGTLSKTRPRIVYGGYEVEKI